jgi:hypothetical protein
MALLLRSVAILCIIQLATADAQDTPAVAAPTATDSPLGLSPDDASALLGQLQKLDEDFAKSEQALLSSALTRIRAATASDSTAAELYLAALRIVSADRTGAAPAAEPEGWRDEQIEWMKESGAPKAIRIQLGWLALLIEASQCEESERPALLRKARLITKEAATVAQELSLLPVAGNGGGAERRGGAGKERGPGNRRDAGQFLTQSVLNSVFSEAYNFQNHIKPPADWSLAPLNLDAVYDRMLLTDARANSPSEIAGLWDERIQIEASLHRAIMSEEAFKKWGEESGRHLVWRKNLDLLQNKVGGRTAGLELIRLFKENPTHPNLASWKKDIDDVIASITGQPDPSSL